VPTSLACFELALQRHLISPTLTTDMSDVVLPVSVAADGMAGGRERVGKNAWPFFNCSLPDCCPLQKRPDPATVEAEWFRVAKEFAVRPWLVVWP
jgi:hypothetical protein